MSALRGSKIFYVIIGLLSAALLASCGGGGGGPAPDPPTGSLEIVNSTTKTMAELYVAAVSDTVWGPDQLSSPIAPGDSVLLTDIPVGYYDSMAVFTDNVSAYFALALDFPITAGETFTLIADDLSLTGSIQIDNNHLSLSISKIYIIYDVTPTPAPGSNSWGAPVYDATPIAPGEAVQFIGMFPDNYDVRIEMSDGSDYVNTISNPDYIPITSGELFTLTVQ